MSSVLGVALAMTPLFYLASVIVEARVVRTRLQRSGGRLRTEPLIFRACYF